MGTAPKPSHKPQSASATPPKKRRRRTVVTGAADDCFACAKRGTQCDRRRPYCSQCIGLDQECSGYKTTLTWGVGVASRGKLRGLSLPVTGSRPATMPPKPQRVANPTPQLTSTRLSTSGTEYSMVATSAYATHASEPTVPSVCASRGQHSGVGASGNTVSTTTMRDVQTPSDIPVHPPLGSYQLSNLARYKTNTPAVMTSDPMYRSAGAGRLMRSPSEFSAPTNCTQNWPGLSLSSTTANQKPTRNTRVQESEEAPLEQENQEEQCSYDPPLWTAGHSPSFPQLLLARSVGRTPRLKYLISYYIEVIAPVIVAFDSPTNPFRTQILRLAEESESLQEAIATLATSNLKQRRQARTIATGRTLPSRMSSLALRALTENTFEDQHDLPILEGLAREEQHHRGMAVRALNSELADPQRRLSDSVLATLLILCLFHICDTGVAQFKTQFAGVKKLLAIRMRTAGTMASDLKWFIRLFTWLDTLTASTNDREVQLGGTCLDITAHSGEEWSLENLTGCDSNLFKLVAQLGRLNLLSQNQAVRAPTPPDLLTATTALPASMLNTTNGASLPGSGPVNVYGLPVPTLLLANVQSRQPPSATFWAEWSSLRQKLEAWRISAWRDESGISSQHATTQLTSHAYMSPPSSPNSQYLVSPQNLPDVFNISESFRHSAILYCERLAYPDLPSSHPRIQNIVQMVMRHMAAVQSDVFLLWPLFITGSECVLEEHRRMIRSRCTDISKDSGFCNNLSCLELLEKIWAMNSDGPGDGGHTHVDAMPAFAGKAQLDGTQLRAPGDVFRWSHVMQAKRADGEYIVV